MKMPSETREHQRIEHVAAIIASHQRSDLPVNWNSVRDWALAQNGKWSFDVSWHDGDYVSEQDFTRVEGCKLSARALESAIELAKRWTR